MSVVVKDTVRVIVLTVHSRIFGYAMGSHMREFLTQLSFSTAGLIISNGILFASLLLAGRLLGPRQFGLFSLTAAIAQLLVIPMMLGMDVAAMRGVARHAEPARRRRIVTSGFFVLLLSSVLIGSLTLAGADLLGAVFHMRARVIRAAAALALAISLRMFFDGVIRGEKKFKFQARGRVLEASTILAVFAILYWLLEESSYLLYAAATITGSAVLTLTYLRRGGAARLIASRYWDKREAWRMWRYIRFGMVGAAAGLLMVGGDKIVVERTLGEVSLGMYAAYYYVSVQIAAQLSYIFVNVFFPSVSSRGNKPAVLKKLDKLVAVAFLPAVLASAGVAALGLKLFSGAYLFSWPLILAMSVYAVMFFVWQVYWWFITSTGPRGVKFAGLNGLLAGTGYLAGIYLLAQRLEIMAPAVSFFIVFLYLAAAVQVWKKKFPARSLTGPGGGHTMQ